MSARPQRVSPVHDLVAAAGAVFGSRMGWERPNVFAPPGAAPVLEYSWDAPNWLPWSAAEQRAARREVALFDQTSFSKYLLTGPDSEQALQWLCTADVAVPPGRVVYTGMLGATGGYESDLTVTRLSPDEFLLVSSSAATERDKAHISERLPAGTAARLVDVTSAYAVLGVMGPRSRELLGALSSADFSDAGFPFGTSREVDLGYFTVRATRITYVGELGWELYVPAECAAGVFAALTAAGARVRAGQRRLLHDRVDAAGEGLPGLRPGADPGVQPGRGGPAVRLQAGHAGPVPGPGSGGEGAGGRAAAAAGVGAGRPGSAGGLGRPMLWGGELLLRDGVPAGHLTSAAWGEAVGGPVGLGYLRDPDGGVVSRDFVSAGRYQVNVGGALYPATVTLRPPFDPGNTRSPLIRPTPRAGG